MGLLTYLLSPPDPPSWFKAYGLGFKASGALTSTKQNMRPGELQGYLTKCTGLKGLGFRGLGCQGPEFSTRYFGV